MKGELARIVAYNVRELRKQAGLSQEALAGRIGRHRNTIALIEAPTTDPTAEAQNITIETLEDLAIGLEVNYSRLVRPPPSSIPTEHLESLKRFLDSPDGNNATTSERAQLEAMDFSSGVPSHKGWIFLLEGIRDAERHRGGGPS